MTNLQQGETLDEDSQKFNMMLVALFDLQSSLEKQVGNRHSLIKLGDFLSRLSPEHNEELRQKLIPDLVSRCADLPQIFDVSTSVNLGTRDYRKTKDLMKFQIQNLLHDAKVSSELGLSCKLKKLTKYLETTSLDYFYAAFIQFIEDPMRTEVNKSCVTNSRSHHLDNVNPDYSASTDVSGNEGTDSDDTEIYSIPVERKSSTNSLHSF